MRDPRNDPRPGDRLAHVQGLESPLRIEALGRYPDGITMVVWEGPRRVGSLPLHAWVARAAWAEVLEIS